MSCPRIENLNQLGTILNLEQSIFSQTLSQILQNSMKQLGLRECHLLNFQIFFRCFSLHEVCGERVRTSDKSEDSRLGRHLVTESAEGLGHEGSGRGGIDEVHLLHVIVRFQWFDDRSDLFVNVEFDTHAGEGSENVTEKNASIRLIIPPGLQRNLHGNIGDFTSFPEGGVLFAQIAVFLNVTSSLTHHPYRDAFGFLTAGGADEEGIDAVSRGIRVGLGHGGLRRRSGEGEGCGGCR
mmetsp:Transcript_40227/g.84491  ORF Transcript_40227/g.84491 Transcript_40227/m.84491 type:complete len:238 (-) Transcript_40227:132-845(-)